MRYSRGIISLVMAVSLALILPGCATSAPKAPSPGPDYSRFKGYKFKIGELKAGSFETPPYIPTKVNFELNLQLKEKQLLAAEGDKKALTVNIISSTSYLFFRREQASNYKELTSMVEVVDTNMPEIIAKTKITSFNAWGDQTSDFTEIDHVRSIVKFLESIVR
jgi:hypothetical protein